MNMHDDSDPRIRYSGTWYRDTQLEEAAGRTVYPPRGQRLRMALEHLGPIFVKFGQVLSTRRDLLPADVAEELELEVPRGANARSVGTLLQKSGLVTDTLVFRYVVWKRGGLALKR